MKSPLDVISGALLFFGESSGVNGSAVKVRLLLAVRAVRNRLVLAFAKTSTGYLAQVNRMRHPRTENGATAVLALIALALLDVVVHVAGRALLALGLLLRRRLDVNDLSVEDENLLLLIVRPEASESFPDSLVVFVGTKNRGDMRVRIAIFPVAKTKRNEELHLLFLLLNERVDCIKPERLDFVRK